MKKIIIGVIAVLVLIVAIVAFQSGDRELDSDEFQDLAQDISDQVVGKNDSEDQIEETEEAQGISQQELSEHSDSNSCWVAYRGQVYDLTAWLNQHPGGSQSILPTCGTAEEFEQAYDNQHGVKESGLLRKQPIGNYLG